MTKQELKNEAEKYVREWFKKNCDGYVDELQVTAFVDGAMWASDTIERENESRGVN